MKFTRPCTVSRMDVCGEKSIRSKSKTLRECDGWQRAKNKSRKWKPK